MTNQQPASSPQLQNGMTRFTSAHLVAGLTVVAALACELGLYEEAENMCLAAHAMCPGLQGIDDMQTIILLEQRQFDEILRRLRGRDDTNSLGFKARCLFELRDPHWVDPAREVVSRNDVPIMSEVMCVLFRSKGVAQEDILTPLTIKPLQSSTSNRGGIRA